MPSPMLMPHSDPPTEDQAEDTRDLLNYEEAAEYLNLSRGRVGGLVMEGTLHAVKLPNTRFKYLRKVELDWYNRRRQGSSEPNPTITGAASLLGTSQGGDVLPRRSEVQVAEPADLAITVLLWALAGSDASAEQLGQMDVRLGDHIRALRAQPGGKEMLADLASRIAGMLARDEGTLPDTERMRVAELLTLLTTPTLQSEAATKK